MHILAFINHLTIANNNNKFNSQVLQQHIREHKIKKKKKKKNKKKKKKKK